MGWGPASRGHTADPQRVLCTGNFQVNITSLKQKQKTKKRCSLHRIRSDRRMDRPCSRRRKRWWRWKSTPLDNRYHFEQRRPLPLVQSPAKYLHIFRWETGQDGVWVCTHGSLGGQWQKWVFPPLQLRATGILLLASFFLQATLRAQGYVSLVTSYSVRCF